jgi:hypothetical protein
VVGGDQVQDQVSHILLTLKGDELRFAPDVRERAELVAIAVEARNPPRPAALRKSRIAVPAASWTSDSSAVKRRRVRNAIRTGSHSAAKSPLADRSAGSRRRFTQSRLPGGMGHGDMGKG